MLLMLLLDMLCWSNGVSKWLVSHTLWCFCGVVESVMETSGQWQAGKESEVRVMTLKSNVVCMDGESGIDSLASSLKIS